MKKICFIVYNMAVFGGVEQVTTSLSSALCDHFEVHVLAIVQTGPLEYQLDDRIKYSCLTKTEKRFSVLQKELKKPIAEYMTKNGIDVCFIQGTFPAYICYPARFKCKTKFVFCDHGALINQWNERAPTIARFLASLFCHKTVTLTEKSCCDYHKRFFVPKCKLSYIYNWIDSEKQSVSEYNRDSKRIVSAGRIGREKGFDMLINACEFVFERYPDWSLDIFGDGDMMPEIKSLVVSKNLQNNINLMGMRTDLKERYKDYSMYAMPSYREGMPLVLLEAKLNQLPIVSFDIATGPREIIRDGIDGILVEPYNIKKFAESICSLIKNPELRQKMSAESRSNLNKFSKNSILNQWIDLVNDLVK